MIEITASVVTQDHIVSKEVLREAFLEVLVEARIIEEGDTFPENCVVTLEKDGVLDEFGFYHVNATIVIPEEEDRIDDFLSLIEGVDTGEDTGVI